MPTTLGRPFLPSWRGNPPQMLQVDIPIWHRFIAKWEFLFINVYYNCLLGGPVLTKEEEADPLKRMWRHSNSLRVDALTETKDEVWIIEVARDPGLRALGQIQTYRANWIMDPVIKKPEKCVIVCELMREDLLTAAGMYGVDVYVV